MYVECQRRKEDYNKHLYKYFEPRITSEMWEDIEYLECWDIGTFDMNVRGFYQDPSTVFSLNSVIGMDKELIWTYSVKCSEQLNKVIQLLRTELQTPKKKSFFNRIDVYM